MGELKLEELRYTLAKYLEIDEKSQDKNEYEYGKIWAMPGTTLKHNEIVANLLLSIKTDIKQKKRKCKVFFESVRLIVNPRKVYYYPDLIFTCHEADLKEKMDIRHPSLVIEVLSEGSFSIDLSSKTDNYLAMPTLKYYLAVSQDEYRVRVWEKVAEKWWYSVYRKLEDKINMPQIDMIFSVEEIYENIEMVVRKEEDWD
ncbi:MAG: Uma2 family endonuclease [Bacteroidia bacterium]